MAAAPSKLPEVVLLRGLLLKCRDPRPSSFGTPRFTEHWHIIGTVDFAPAAPVTPFLLQYSGAGFTAWDCAQRLPENLRKKILALLRSTCRYATTPPAFIEVHDLTALEGDAVQAPAQGLIEAFHRDVWRQEFLKETPVTWVDLQVPFAEKDQAKALGASWNAAGKCWRIKAGADMSAFARWLP